MVSIDTVPDKAEDFHPEDKAETELSEEDAQKIWLQPLL